MSYIAVGYCFGLRIYKAYAFFFLLRGLFKKFCTSFKTEFILFSYWSLTTCSKIYIGCNFFIRYVSIYSSSDKPFYHLNVCLLTVQNVWCPMFFVNVFFSWGTLLLSYWRNLHLNKGQKEFCFVSVDKFSSFKLLLGQ